MTFTEAAVEVLRLVGKPLHYKKITEVAIERNLLSHVGKTPEVTMSSRLATMVKRDRGEAPIIKVKPGVFGLREFNEEQLADLSGDVDELPEVEVENEQDKALEAQAGAVELPSIVPSVEPRKPLPGADVFPEEDDDDEPILGGDDDDDDDEEGEGDEAAAGAAQPGAESRSSRRRRKRRRRGGAEEGAEVEARPAREVREAPAAREREPRELREPRHARESPRRDERGRDGRGRDDRSRDDRGRDDRGRDDRSRNDRIEREEPLDFSREPGDGDLLGKDLADAVASVLSQGGPRGLPVIRIADQLVRRGRLSGDPGALVPTIMAAVRADIARKKIEQTRPRFKAEAGTVVLTEFLLPQDVVRAEQDVLRAAERQRDRVRRAFLRRLGELPGAGVAELIATWLNAEGVVGLRAVRRPGAGVGELHLAGTLRRGADEQRLAIVVYREARELSRERVIEARGSLHYYGNASVSWLISFGSVTSGAREEASAPAAGPVALYDGLSLATAMERQGVGLATQQVAISALDFELLDALRGGQAPRDFDQDRGRDRERGRDAGSRDITPRDRGDRDRGDRDRNERGDRNERSDRNERGERGDRHERPRLTLERPRPSLEDNEAEQEVSEEELEADATLDEGDEVIDAALAEATPGTGEAGEEGEAREGSRRRRRRRRRKGGRPGEAQAEGETQAAGEDAGEGAAEATGEGEGDRDNSERDNGDRDNEHSGWGDDADERSPAERDDYGRGERSSLYGDEEGSGHQASRDEPRDDADDRDDDRDQRDGSDDERDDADDDDRDDDTDEERSRRDDDDADEGGEGGDGEERDGEDGDTPESSREPTEGDVDPDDETRDPYSGRRGHG